MYSTSLLVELMEVKMVWNMFTVAVCNGCNLPARWVIHVNGPTNGDADAFDKLERCVKNCLVVADTRNFKSIALPSIGSGK